MKTRKVGLVVLALALAGALALGGFLVYSRVHAARTLVLATTTSTYDSGLLDVLVPPFEKANRCKVDIVAVGTGQALELGRNGDADVLLVHAPASEKAFMDEGHGLSRRAVMYNDFVLVGPVSDPLGLRQAPDLKAALQAIAKAGAEGNTVFLSRGDDSGTDKKEKGLWAKFAIETAGGWYQETGSGMGDTLRMAAERQAYTLADRGTYLALYGPGSPGEGRLSIVQEGDPDLFNPYHVIVVNPTEHPNVNRVLAERFSAYLVSDKGREIISSFGVDKFGQPLFRILEQEAGG